MEDPDGTLSSVAQCIEQLRRTSSTTQEKEQSLKQLLDLIETRDNAFSAVGSHSQAVPILVSLLRSGSFGIKIQASTVLCSLCKEDELRVKVLLGGSIPALLSLLKSNSSEGQVAAAKTIYAVSQGGARDHVGSKIFSTEGVVPVLWEKLKNGLEAGSMVDNLLTGTLRNLSNSTEGFWLSTMESGGVQILVKLLASGEASTLANVCFLLGCLMMEDSSVCSAVLASGATKQLLKLLGPGSEASVRAEAAGALKSLSAQCKEARKEIASSNGIPALINATIAPSKEFMQGEHAQALQENSMCALANISGGLSYVISSLGESLESCNSTGQIADTLGALASALMIYDTKADSVRASDPVVIEQILVKQLKTKSPFLVQERTIEALASLYGNPVLSRTLDNSNAKHLLVGLATMADSEVQDYLIRSLLVLCSDEGSLWRAFQGREGVQLLISLLGLSSEQQQECAVSLLSLLSSENDESKWAITAAGGIPPLVQILETGSVKAKEDSATILGNLCNHSEDIRACVQSADAVPALLWLLKNGSDDGKEIAAKTLNHLIHKSDTGTISQLSALLTSDQPESKVYVLDALRSLLSVAPLNDILLEGSAANDAIETMIKILGSTKEETQAKSAAALAGLFHCRKDLRESHIAVKTLWSVMRLLNVESDKILVEAAGCLAAIFLSIKQNSEVAAVGRHALAPVMVLANSSVLEVAEQGTRALANLLLDNEISLQAVPQEIIPPAARVLRDGTIDGRTHAAAAIAHLLQPRSLDLPLSDDINRSGTVLALISLLESTTADSAATSEVLNALALLSRTKGTVGNIKPPWAVLAEHPQTITPLVSCIAEVPPLLQDKAVEVLSRLCCDQPVVLGDSIASSTGCIASIAQRVINSNQRKIKIGGAALLICAANEHTLRAIEALNEASLSTHLVHSLVAMLNESSTAVIFGDTIATWLLSVLACHDDRSRSATVEAGAIEVLTDKISQHLLLSAQSEAKEDSRSWTCALLLAVLFLDREIISEHATMHSIPVLASFLRSEEPASRYFSAQALNSLVCNGDRGTLLAVANSGAAVGLISLLGCAETDISDLLELAREFSLAHRTPRGSHDRSPGILFSSAEITRHESASGAVSQLVAVLRLGGRNSRYSAARALESLFFAEQIRNGEAARQAIQPLVEILSSGPEREQHAAVAALVALLSGSPSRALAVAEVEMSAVDVLCRILSSNCSPELKGAAAELCYVLFGNTRIRSSAAAARCVEPLLSVVRALDRLLEDDQLAELVAQYGTIVPLVGLLFGRNYALHEAVCRALVKIGKDRPACKIDMVKAGVIESVLGVLPEAPDFLCVAMAELLRILTNNASIAKGSAAGKVVDPLFSLLTRPEIGTEGQHNALQVLVNILEHPQCRAEYNLSSQQAVEPVIALLDSPTLAVQQLAAELLSHLLLEEHLQKDSITQQAIGPLVQALGSGVPIVQQRAIKALVNVALSWPSAIAKEGGVYELSKVIMQVDPPLPQALWESASSVLSSILQFSSEFYLEVPVAVLVKLLRSGTEGTVVGALNALLVLESDDSTSAEAMAESGAIEALLDLLRSHQCEETAARLLEALLNNMKIRETKAARAAISPLSLYLLDPQTQSQQGRLLSALALGDLFQNEALARTPDAVSACRALVNLLEDQPTEEMKVVAICALQNLVMCNRSNKRAVAEAGGVQVVLDLISSSDPDTSVQAAMFIKLLFSGLSIQEYASSETVRAITAAVEKDLWASGSVNEEYLRALNALLGNFPRLRASEPATLSIPHLVTSLKTGSEATQEAALEALNLLRQAWSACPPEVSKTQAVAASEAIPLLQYLIQSGPRASRRRRSSSCSASGGAHSQHQACEQPQAVHRLHRAHPEWNEPFAWAFDSPPKGQKLHISCKNKSKLGKSSFGKVTIQIDRVVMLGSVAGEYTLLPASKSGPRNLEIEFVWSNK
ncbi:unnamed protein product [Spirodela intermedia]|uniref:Uncharacterized protein n=1 Tax=Spirodela intermedia TaxID=51605 RepID=A0A7I8J4S5_SPIIN|nr:unnamed protein product [Spirodela intermedia]CAA6665079.1 unnamed protein product [Spirodela intermedia]